MTGRFLPLLFLFSFLFLLLQNAVLDANATELANISSAREEGLVETSGVIESRKLLGDDDGSLVIGSSRRSLKVRIRGGGATGRRSAASSHSHYRFPAAFLAAALAAAILNCM